MPVTRLRYVAFSHVEADECGALNDWLAVAPHAAPLCGTIAAMVSIGDLADRAPRALADGEALSLGRHTVRWFDAPHLPHGWECGFLMERPHGTTLLCGDLFTQPGAGERRARPRPTSSARAKRSASAMDYFSHAPQRRRAAGEARAASSPTTLACMHGSAWRGDGAALLRALAGELAR